MSVTLFINNFLPVKSKFNFLCFEVVTKVTQSEGLHYPLLILEWLCFSPSTDLNTASSDKLLFASAKLYLNISSDLLTCCDETTKEFTSYAEKPKRNKLKIANKLLIVTSDEINLQSKHDLICHVAKMKAATSEHNFYGWQNIFFSVFSIFIIHFNKTERNIFNTQRKQCPHNCPCIKLNISIAFGKQTSQVAWFKILPRGSLGLFTDKTTTTKNKSQVEHELCLAHGCAVNYLS